MAKFYAQNNMCHLYGKSILKLYTICFHLTDKIIPSVSSFSAKIQLVHFPRMEILATEQCNNHLP